MKKLVALVLVLILTVPIIAAPRDFRDQREPPSFAKIIKLLERLISIVTLEDSPAPPKP